MVVFLIVGVMNRLRRTDDDGLLVKTWAEMLSTKALGHDNLVFRSYPGSFASPEKCGNRPLPVEAAIGIMKRVAKDTCFDGSGKTTMGQAHHKDRRGFYLISAAVFLQV